MMIRRAGIILLLTITLLSGGCSVHNIIDKFIPDDDRGLAMRVVHDLRAGDAVGLGNVVAPAIRDDSLARLRAAKTQFPASAGETRIFSYNSQNNWTNGRQTQFKAFTLVTTDQRIWTTTQLEFRSEDGPLQLTAWDVSASREKPATLKALDTVATVAPIVAIVVLLCVICGVALIVYLIRRTPPPPTMRR